jgi:hypothetical protein
MTKTLEIHCDNNITWVAKLYETGGSSTKLAGEVESSDFVAIQMVSEAWCRDKWDADTAVSYVRIKCSRVRVVRRKIRL